MGTSQNSIRDNGTTGAWVKRLTREGVFEAIRSRRVFASTGARAVLDFRANGTFMGGETRASGPPRLEVSVKGEGDLERVEIVRDHEIVHAVRGSGPAASFVFVDQAGRPSGRKSSYYYVRVVQKDRAMAWSSPVWINWE